jgi:hypothetical protein
MEVFDVITIKRSAVIEVTTADDTTTMEGTQTFQTFFGNFLDKRESFFVRPNNP